MHIAPPAPKNDKVFSLVTNLRPLSTSIKKWFLKFEPNEASLVSFLCRCLFQSKVSNSSENMATRLHKVLGPFKSHQPTELEKGDDLIKYPLVKHDTSTKKSDKLQTPVEVDLRARSNFVFAASQKFFDPGVMEAIRKSSQRDPIPDFSSNLCSCAVAITAEVKATSSLASLTAAWNQWSSLAYTQMMERISISREATLCWRRKYLPAWLLYLQLRNLGLEDVA